MRLLCEVPGREEVRVLNDEWEEMDVAVDSGSTENVVGSEMLRSVATVPGGKKGVQYEVANGVLVENEGEKKVFIETEEGAKKALTFQVTDVSKPLLSVRKVIRNGHRVVFQEGDSYIEDLRTGDKMTLKDKGGMFVLKMWAKAGF